MSWTPEEFVNGRSPKKRGDSQESFIDEPMSAEEFASKDPEYRFSDTWRGVKKRARGAVDTLDAVSPIAEQTLGGGEALVSMLSTLVTSPMALAGAAVRAPFADSSRADEGFVPEYNRILDKLTYKPRSKTGKNILETLTALREGGGSLNISKERANRAENEVVPPWAQADAGPSNRGLTGPINPAEEAVYRTMGEVGFDIGTSVPTGRTGAKVAGITADAAARSREARRAKALEALKQQAQMAEQAEIAKRGERVNDPANQMDLPFYEDTMSFRDQKGHNPNLSAFYKQGDLFDGVRPWSPEEFAARPEMTPELLAAATDDPQPSARDRDVMTREGMLAPDSPVVRGDVDMPDTMKADQLSLLGDDTMSGAMDSQRAIDPVNGAVNSMDLIDGVQGRARDAQQARNLDQPVPYDPHTAPVTGGLRGRGRRQGGALRPDLFTLENLKENLLKELQELWSAGKKGPRFDLLKQQLANVEEALEKAKAQTPESPMPKDPFKGPGKRQAGAVKLPGGMWDAQSKFKLIDKLLRQMMGVYEIFSDREKGKIYKLYAHEAFEDPSNPDHPQAVHWVNAAQKYLNKYFGTDRDPLKDVRIPILRQHHLDSRWLGDLADENGTIRWEDLTDALISAHPARTKYPRLPDTVPGNEPVWEMGWGMRNEPSSGYVSKYTDNAAKHAAGEVTFHDFLQHVGDYLRNHVPEDQLPRYDFVRAVQETLRQDERQAKAMKRAKADQKGTTPVIEYEDGHSWRKVESAEALKLEGDMMGHCVGGYCEYVNNGRSEIYSLRDKDGNAHVTIEVRPPEIFGRRLTPEQVEMFRTSPDADFPKPTIIQIKGKQNRAPVERYHPYVQDFVKSKEWVEVYEAENAGLTAFGSRSGTTYPRDYRHADGTTIRPESFKQAGLEPGKLYTRDEWDAAAKKIDPEAKAPDWSAVEREHRGYGDAPLAPIPEGGIFRGPGRRQRGAIFFGGEGKPNFVREYAKNPEVAVRQLAQWAVTHGGFAAFEKELTKALGPEAKLYAQSLYKANTGQDPSAAPARKDSQTSAGSSVSSTQGGGSQPPIRSSGTPLASDFNEWSQTTGKDFVAQLHEKIKNNDVQDLDLEGGLLASGSKRLAYLLAQGQRLGRKHPIIGWARDKIDWAERTANAVASEILYGWKFAPSKWGISSLRKARRVADEDSMMHEYNGLTSKDQLQLLDVLQEFNGVKDLTPQELAGKGLNPSQIRAYQNLRRGLDRAWDEVLVPLAKELGMPIPEKIPGYIPMMWFGDYRVWGKNRETGKMDFVYGVSSMSEAKRAIKQLNERFGDKYEFKPQDVTNTHNEFTSTGDAFLDAIRLFGNSSPEGKMLAEAMHQILQSRGASRHKLHRNEERTKGFAGELETGRSLDPITGFRQRRLINFEKSLESYVRGLVKYAHNKKLMSELDTVLRDPKVESAYPKATDASLSMLDAFFGRDKFLDSWLKDAMIWAGRSTRLPQDVTAAIATWVLYSQVMFWRIPFYFAQSIQDIMIVPRMMMQKGMGYDASIIKAMAQGWGDYFMSSRVNADDIAYVRKMGIIEPKFNEQLLFTPGLKGGRSFWDISKVVNHLTLNSLSAAIDTSVRWRSWLILKRFFENSGMTPEQAREAASKNSLDVMVEYEAWKRSPLYREQGAVGNIWSPLTTFLNNIVNRFGEYGHQALPGRGRGLGHPAALVGLAGVFASLAGSSGFPGREEYDLIVDGANKILKTEIPTATDAMINLSNKLPKDSKFSRDLIIFGPPSAISGANLSGTLGASSTLGSLMPMTGDPMPRTVVNMLTAGGNVAGRRLAGDEIPVHERLQALKSVLPTAPFHGMVENSHSPSTRGDSNRWAPQDHDVVVPEKGADGRFRRTPKEQWMKVFGMKSTDEALFDMKQRRLEVKKQRMNTRRADAIEIAADHFADPNERSSTVIRNQSKKYMENGGDMRRWSGEVLENMHRRYNTYTERELMEALRSRNPRALKLLLDHGLIQGERGGYEKMSAGDKDFEKEFSDLKRRSEAQDVFPHYDIDKRNKGDRIIRKLPDGRPNDRERGLRERSLDAPNGGGRAKEFEPDFRKRKYIRKET